MSPEISNGIETKINSQLSQERESIYLAADNLARRVSMPAFLQSFLNAADFWTGKNSVQKRFDWELSKFEGRANFYRKQAKDTKLPNVYHDFLNSLNLDSL